MKQIIVLGWGSLIWSPSPMIFQKQWQSDGPSLPIEFARISKDKRLTLVIQESAKPTTVLWNTILAPTLEAAIDSLKAREKTIEKHIGYIDLVTNQSYSQHNEIISQIKKWMKSQGHQQCIWTDLPSNFTQKTNLPFDKNSVYDYIQSLDSAAQTRALEYIEKAPQQIWTELRDVLY